jgi:hypothetical protein
MRVYLCNLVTAARGAGALHVCKMPVFAAVVMRFLYKYRAQGLQNCHAYLPAMHSPFYVLHNASNGSVLLLCV